MLKQALLLIKNVAVKLGQRTILNGINLSLKQGDIGCILGSSGCGKTTLLRAIAGFESITEGEISLNQKCVSSRHKIVPAYTRRIGMVFQDYALFPHLTVQQNVCFGLQNLSSAQKQKRSHELLDMMALTDFANAYPHEISGGQKQRVALARALAPRPQLILLDEPFSSLDATLRQQVAHNVRDVLKQQNTTALLVTHDQQEAFAMADHIGVMDKGHLLQWDTPYTLYHQPAHRWVADFIGEGVFIPAQIIDENRLKTAFGEVESVIPNHYRVGQTLDLFIRPDDVIHDDASPFKALVVDKVFRGASFIYTLELNDGSRILSLVPSHHNHSVGTHIGIYFEFTHAIVFESEASQCQ